MPITSTDVQYRLSGGAANSNQDASIGGTKSSNSASASIFDNVSSAEAAAGESEYRCVYVHNAHATLTAQGTRIWVQANTPSTSTDVAIGLGTSAVGGTETAVADENTAPASVTFSSPTNFAGGLVIGDLAPGQSKAVWIRRAVTAGAAVASDSFTLRVQCDTLP